MLGPFLEGLPLEPYDKDCIKLWCADHPSFRKHVLAEDQMQQQSMLSDTSRLFLTTMKATTKNQLCMHDTCMYVFLGGHTHMHK